MKYYTSKYGNIIKVDLGNITLVSMEESSEEYKQFLEFLNSGGTVNSSNFSTMEEDTLFNIEKETQTYLKRINDGAIAISKFSAEIRVAKLSGVISEEGQKVVDKVLKPVRDEILAGQWISAKDELLTIGSSIIGQKLYERILTEIQTYIIDNY
ncbi:MAG TPA: hypothetical protein PKC87_01945 [Candidatus Absconditabacterales bacterium]|nr:hypothetical protein [Candidatus Absconditabacterales bacterium]